MDKHKLKRLIKEYGEKRLAQGRQADMNWKWSESHRVDAEFIMAEINKFLDDEDKSQSSHVSQLQSLVDEYYAKETCKRYGHKWFSSYHRQSPYSICTRCGHEERD